MKRPVKRRASAAPAAEPVASRLAPAILWLLVLVPPVVFSPTAKDAFRLPKELLAGSLALASLVALAGRLRAVGPIDLPAVFRRPAVLAALPFLAVATLSLATSEHPIHVRAALVPLWIGGAALVGWSLALGRDELRRLLAGLAVPGAVLAILAILQFHRLYDPFQFAGRTGERVRLISLAGGVFDLGAYLLLPVLAAEIGVLSARTPARRWLWGAVLALEGYALVLTRSLTVLAALAAASLAVAWLLLPRRRLAGALAGVVLVAVVLGLALAPLRHRVTRGWNQLAAGKIEDILTGRPDAWRAALWMWARHPLLGVGQGAFVAEFAPAKLALLDDGVAFYREHRQPHFAHAHDELLNVAAELGTLGVLAALWALAVAVRALRRHARDPGCERGDFALMVAGTVALGVLALAWFPLHLALIAYPYLLLASRILREPGAAPAEARP